MRKQLLTRQPRTHIVRVYRITAHGVVGQIESVRTGLVRPFRTAAELWRAVQEQPARIRDSQR